MDKHGPYLAGEAKIDNLGERVHDIVMDSTPGESWATAFYEVGMSCEKPLTDIGEHCAQVLKECCPSRHSPVI